MMGIYRSRGILDSHEFCDVLLTENFGQIVCSLMQPIFFIYSLSKVLS